MRVALYARVSTQEQAINGLSLDAQVSALKEWAKDKVIVGIYVDEGISARCPASKRPQLQMMLNAVKDGRVDLIAFCRLDRFFRNVKEYYKVEDILEKNGAAWRAIHEDYETETAAGRLKVNIMLAVAQDEADRTGERIKAVFNRKREKGLVATGKTPVGIKILDGHYAPDDDADKVRDIFNTYLNTHSVMLTARTTTMTDHGIRYLLKNRNYVDAGVIDEATFSRVQELIAQRSTRLNTGTHRAYLFSGLVFCPYCGHRLSAMTTGGHRYYRCVPHFEGKCQGYHISEPKLETYLLKRVMPSVDAYNLRVRKEQKKTVDTKKLKAKLNKLADLYLEDLIPKDKYEAEYKATQQAIVDAEREKQPIDKAEIQTVLEAYKTLSDEGKKIFWNRVVKSITPTETGFDVVLNYTYRIKTEDILTYVQNGLNTES